MSALRPAVWPRSDSSAARLLHVDTRTGSLRDARLPDLPGLLGPGDLLVVNDASTLPASLVGHTRLGPVEVRLAGIPERERAAGGSWPAVLFGPGSWRQRTEDRPPPPRLAPGDEIRIGALPAQRRAGGEDGLRAEVAWVSPLSHRLVELVFGGSDEALLPALYRLGRPVQYSHLVGPLALWHVQTAFGSRPWSVEMPSAGWPLRPPLVRELRRRGVAVTAVTHAAGLSSTGDALLDALLPLPERTEIGADAAAVIERTKRSGGRVVAVGTSVVRALEGRALEGRSPLRSGVGTTRLRIGPDHALRVLDGLLTGLHSPGETHFELLRAFAPRRVLEAGLRHAVEAGYATHEFGDLSLLLAA